MLNHVIPKFDNASWAGFDEAGRVFLGDVVRWADCWGDEEDRRWFESNGFQEDSGEELV